METMADIPAPLIDDIADGRCLPFVGAGFSLNAECDGVEMPDWPMLARMLASAAGVDNELEGPDAASAFERKFGRVHLIDAIRRALNTDSVFPGDAHLAFVQLPFDTIYTTNFDLLLEEALREKRRPYRSLVGELQLPFHAGFFTTNVVKMHGDVRHEEHFVVTRRDYESFLDEYPVIATHLSAMLITRTPLFLGYSRTDSDFLNIQRVIEARLGKFQKMPYLIQFDVSDEEIDQGLDLPNGKAVHILSLSTETRSRGEALAELFQSIQGELDARAGKKLRQSEPDAFEPIPRETLDLAYKSPEASDILASSSSLCFVMMPLSDESEAAYRSSDAVYQFLIEPAVADVGLVALRADHLRPSRLISEQVRAAIRESRICMADISDSNPNVLYELGIALAQSKPVVLLARVGSHLPFDIMDQRFILYDPDDLESAIPHLRTYLQALLEMGRLQEAEQLISAGMYRAAIAVIGVVLEHTLIRLLASSPKSDSPRVRSIGAMADALFKMGVITRDERDSLRRIAGIRNRAVHELLEPTQEEASLALELAQHFVDSYPTED
jgi:uncharacterized protein YutE (UPF0331/DUF86 family)